MSVISFLSTTTLPEFVDLVRREWTESPQMVDSPVIEAFLNFPIEDHTGNTRLFEEIDVETYANEKPEGAPAVNAVQAKGYSKLLTLTRFAKQVKITYEMRTDNKYEQVTSRLTGLMHMCPKRMELDLTHRLTFADAVSYVNLDGSTVDTTVGDGLAVISGVHTLTGSSLTYSNRVPGNPQFSRGGLAAAERIANNNILSNLGERRKLNFNTILTGDDPDVVNEVRILLESMSDPTYNNSGVTNVYRTKYRHLVIPQLASTAAGALDDTKRRRWFLAALNGSPESSWQAYISIKEQPTLKTPAPGNNLENGETDDWTFGVRARYGIVVVTGRGIIMSTGNGD
jgi:hypothetical protein